MKRLIIALLAVYPLLSQGQDMKELYQKADSFYTKYSSMSRGLSDIEAIKNSPKFWYSARTANGKEFFLLDAEKKQEPTPAFDQKRLALSLETFLHKEVKAYQLPFQKIRFAGTDTLSFIIDKQEYLCTLADYKIIKGAAIPEDSYWGGVYRENSKEKIKSPDGINEAYINEGNLWIRNIATGQAKAISTDGSVYDYYSSNIYWSPDSKKIICCKYRPAEVRKLLLISSSPKDQLQPKTEEYDYPKPGDALPIRRPVLFFINENRSVEYKVPDVDAQFDLNNIRWDKSSTSFSFHFNKRGHQQYVIYEGNIQSDQLRTIVNEQSNTFIYYNAVYEHWFENEKELLWISERDGWRHIYLYDVPTGKVKKQLTKGEWVVKNVVHVDEIKRTILFKGCGMDAGEDPYLEKYYLLNIDNGNIKALTPENGNHNVTFSSDYAYMVDTYSRTDLPPTTVLRSAKDGKIIRTIFQPDIKNALAAGWRMPEVFSAKGRDGKTDIWGMIIRPNNFDPNKKYPVIEYIYAGPHDSHVPKSFALAHRASHLTELGFIVVMIDGMGTANRSKAFHDVCWKNLKDAGFPDRIAWMKSAADKYPEMDITRVGIYGGSAGGQNSMGAVLFHPEFYKVAVAACGCHDNRMDKIWWNEQWMGYPIGKEYEECSNVVNAHLLKGKLMLILGELDNNVDPSSTLQVVNALQQSNKEFDFVILPGARHTLGETYGERKRRDFFVKNLIGLPTPNWNEQ
ncbi:S9 family peptidase [Dysgonomonas capnocytophagoides]|uniref:S9 family peptidase n=1 Tax=Dysgonomonas capnocytophagoides TaxID=45254 RepID=A0A4Y8L6K7_9BACT|nr:S9 family peptidase [Dysgonomonas capnocytophagoides]TFD97891.1 S9 family peptidase [Dysgonomonas capnocytophagoides]